MQKHDAQINGFAVVKKVPNQWQKIVFTTELLKKRKWQTVKKIRHAVLEKII